MSATWITYEGGTLGATVGVPDSTGTANAGSTFLYDGTHVLDGSKALKITPAASTLAESRVAQGLNTNKLAITVPFYHTVAKTADEGIFRIEDTTGAKIISLAWNSASRMKLSVVGGTSVYTNATAAIPLNTWVIIKLWIQIGATATTGTVKFGVYNSSGGVINTAGGGIDSVFNSSAQTLGTVNIDRFWIGRDGAQAATDARWYDTVGYDPAATDFLLDYGLAPLSGTGTMVTGLATIDANPIGGTSPFSYSISPSTGTTSLGSGKYIVPQDASATTTYTVTITDSGTPVQHADVVFSVPPIPAGSTPWPKHPSGAVPSSTWA